MEEGRERMSTRPKVVTYSVASLDGRITVAPGVLLLHGDERWSEIAGTEDGYGRVRARFAPEAMLEGSGSFVVEGDEPGPLPEPAGPVEGLYQDFLPTQVVGRPGHSGWFTVVDGRGRVRWAYKEWPDEAWRGWHLLVLVARSTPAGYLVYLRGEGIPYLVAGEERVDLGKALARMGRALGVRTVVSPAGGRLSGALLRAGLVDEVVIEFVPAIIGGRGTPALFDAEPLEEGERPVGLAMVSVEARANGRVWARYAVRRSEDAQGVSS
jgi:2,5-diamino-6-(ribosylamino)-4(3H)-pyrimidinone 5'-phosphate reductase